MTHAARDVLLSRQSEREWRQQVLTWAKRAGWRRYFTFDARHSIPGFPDLVLCRPPRLVFAELKAARGKLTDEQRAWLADLLLVPGLEVHCWRPTDEVAVRAVLFGESA